MSQGYVPTIVTRPRAAVGITSRMRGVKECSSSKRLAHATSTTIAMSNDETSCWCDRFRSAVRKASNLPVATASSSPLRLLAHPSQERSSRRAQ